MISPCAASVTEVLSLADHLTPRLLGISASGFTMLFTTSMQEESIVADNDPQAEILALSLFI